MHQHRILLLEDDLTDAQLTRHALVDSGVQAEFHNARTEEEFFGALKTERFSLVISDSCVGNLSAFQALNALARIQPESGFIVVSGGFDEAQANLARRAGAIEWVPKDQLSRLAPIAKLALERAALRTRDADLGRRNQHLNDETRAAQRLVQAVRDLSLARGVGTIREVVRRAARELTGADGATFVMRDNDKCHYVDEDAIGPLWKGQKFPLTSCISGWAMLNNEAAVVPDIELDARIPIEAYRPTFVKSLVMVPIRGQESPLGAIGNYWATKHTATHEEVQRLKALADSTCIALENVRLYTELEERVRARTSDLREANRALEEFSYFASHDLRAPVRHMRAYADILESECGTKLEDSSRHALGKIKNAGKTMSELLDSFLALARIGRHSLKPRKLDMQAIALDASNALNDQAAHSAEVRIGTLPQAEGDEALVRQVWLNLIGNAIKFSSTREKPVVELGARFEGHEVHYFVRDNGIGFDPALAGQLFTAFRRIHSGSQFSGNGIGLSIVERIVTRHGGRVWAESALGEGATFYFTLGRADS